MKRRGQPKAWRSYYEQRGQFNKAITYRQQALEESRKLQPPMIVDIQQLQNLGLYVRPDVSQKRRRSTRRSRRVCSRRSLSLDRSAKWKWRSSCASPMSRRKAIESVDQGIQTVGFDLLKSLVVRARARLAELRGNCEDAIKYRQEQLALEPNSLGVHGEIARCYRTLGQINTAIEHAQMTLKVRPFDARANYEIALDYLANNDRSKALEHLRRAVQVWSEADPAYTLAADAKKKLRELEAGSDRDRELAGPPRARARCLFRGLTAHHRTLRPRRFLGCTAPFRCASLACCLPRMLREGLPGRCFAAGSLQRLARSSRPLR